VWRETTYASLSTIACAITGTAWSGRRFFGLRAGVGEADGPMRAAPIPTVRVGVAPASAARKGATMKPTERKVSAIWFAAILFASIGV
jgi:hypothetical protein